MGRQINASVLLLINEMELSIYRFLTLGAKKSKSNLDRSSQGLTSSLAVGAFNAWQVTVTLDQTSTRKANTSTGKKRLLEERVCFLHLSTKPRSGRGNQLTDTLASSADWLVPLPVHHFQPENLSFSGLFASSTQARTLDKIICQF